MFHSRAEGCSSEARVGSRAAVAAGGAALARSGRRRRRRRPTDTNTDSQNTSILT